MPRKARVEFPGAVYRSLDRGDRQEAIVRNDAEGHDLAYRDYWRDERDRIVAWKRSTDNSLNGMEDGRGDQYQYDAI
jgi:hypothetical protein